MLLFQCLFEQIGVLVGGFYGLRKILIDDEHFFNQTLCNNIFFGNFDNLRIFYTFRRSGTADNFVRMEILNLECLNPSSVST